MFAHNSLWFLDCVNIFSVPSTHVSVYSFTLDKEYCIFSLETCDLLLRRIACNSHNETFSHFSEVVHQAVITIIMPLSHFSSLTWIYGNILSELTKNISGNFLVKLFQSLCPILSTLTGFIASRSL